MLNYQTVDFLASQLEDQYNKQVAAGLDPLPVEEQVPGFFRAQAAKLAANNVRSIYDVQQADGGIVNAATGEPIKDVVLKSSWETDPEAYRFRDPVALEERGGGKYTRWGKDLSITGQGDYGLTFVDNKPVFTPYWKDTKNFDVGDAMKTAAAIAAVYYGGQYLLAEGGAAAGAGTGAGAGAGTGTAIVGTPGVSTIYPVAAPSVGVSTLAPQVAGATGSLLAADAALASGGAPISTAAAVPASQLAYPAVEVASIPNASLAPTSFQAALPGMGIETAASAAPFTAAPGSFQAAVPSLLAPAAATAGGIGATEALRTAAVANALLNPPAIPQQGLLGRGGGQPRGVDFSPLYQNNIVGLLPLAERYRRSLI